MRRSERSAVVSGEVVSGGVGGGRRRGVGRRRSRGGQRGGGGVVEVVDVSVGPGFDDCSVVHAARRRSQRRVRAREVADGSSAGHRERVAGLDQAEAVEFVDGVEFRAQLGRRCVEPAGEASSPILGSVGSPVDRHEELGPDQSGGHRRARAGSGGLRRGSNPIPRSAAAPRRCRRSRPSRRRGRCRRGSRRDDRRR